MLEAMERVTLAEREADAMIRDAQARADVLVSTARESARDILERARQEGRASAREWLEAERDRCRREVEVAIATGQTRVEAECVVDPENRRRVIAEFVAEMRARVVGPLEFRDGT